MDDTYRNMTPGSNKAETKKRMARRCQKQLQDETDTKPLKIETCGKLWKRPIYRSGRANAEEDQENLKKDFGFSF